MDPYDLDKKDNSYTNNKSENGTAPASEYNSSAPIRTSRENM